jgi:hypothetical protein
MRNSMKFFAAILKASFSVLPNPYLNILIKKKIKSKDKHSNLYILPVYFFP